MSSVPSQVVAHRSSVSPTRAEQTAHLLALAVTSPPAERIRLQDEVVRLNLAIARTVAHRYRSRGEPLDDLEQVAALGLLKAVRHFDPAHGKDFLSYAIPTIRGEVKRHFRDHSWMVRPPRRIQELQPRIVAATGQLSAALNRSPTPYEVADHLDTDPENVIEALTSDGCFHAASLDAPLTSTADDPATSLLGVLGRDETGYALIEARADLEPALDDLAPRDRHVLTRRISDGWTQQEIADELHMSQMQVSRILARIRTQLHDAISVAVA